MVEGIRNLYVHFPFCRRKCTYCALYSRAARPTLERESYAAEISRSLRSLPSSHRFETVYFGGGTPALCGLEEILETLCPHLSGNAEFTVELHPLDISTDLLSLLASGGVNRISVGVESLDDSILKAMGRGYCFREAEHAIHLAKKFFDNTGIDLIAGYPDAPMHIGERDREMAKWDLRHCSVYSLILEDKSILGSLAKRGKTKIPDDDATLDFIRRYSAFLEDAGFVRYEISNWAKPGFECRHNMSVWRGEDYIGLGDGAHGRTGLERTENFWFVKPALGVSRPASSFAVTPGRDETERAIFRLRTREGMNPAGHPERESVLRKFADEGLLVREGRSYRLTLRGTEICDSILAELI